MNNTFKKLLTTIAISLLFLAQSHIYCMLNNIADTDTILQDDYKYLSLANGAIAWETGAIRRLYDFGQIFPVYGMDKKGRKIIENYEHPEKTHKTVRLIHALFYRIPGSTGETDFGVTMQLAKDKPEDVITLIAQILMQCKQLQQYNNQFHQTIDFAQKLVRTLTQENLEKLGKKTNRTTIETKIKKAQENPWNKQDADAFLSLYKSIAKNLSKDLDEQTLKNLNENKNLVEEFFHILSGIIQNLRNLLKPEVFKKRETVDAIMWHALQECDPNNPNMIYLPYMVETIFLAFIYKKYSYDRTLLKIFYNELNKQLDGKVLVRELDETWISHSFAPVTQEESFKQLELILSTKDILQSISQNFAPFVYNTFQIGSIPTPIGYADATFEYEKNKKTAKVADCMDNTMRNFINICAYNATQNTFNIETLFSTLNITAAHSTLLDFLKKFSNVNKASSSHAHNAWLQVISNIPYVAYNRMVNAITQQSIEAIHESKGYITIPEHELNKELINNLNNNKYQIAKKNEYCYELQPSVKNIIIVLDYLLQLNLFMQNGGLIKEFTRPDFITVYFPKLCNTLKIIGFLSTKKDQFKSELNIDFDALDYTSTTLYATLQLQYIKCEFSINSRHGELILFEIGGYQTEFISLLKKITNFNKEPNLSFLITNKLCKQTIYFTHLMNNQNYLFNNLFASPLENTNLLESITTRTFSLVSKTISLNMKLAFKDLLIRLVKNQPDMRQQQMLRLTIFQLFLNTLNDKDIKSDASDTSFKEIATIALQEMLYNDWQIETTAANLFDILLEKKQIVELVIKTAAQGFDNENYKIYSRSKDLFIKLFEKKYAFLEGIDIAQKTFNNKNIDIAKRAFDLFRYLIAENYAFEESKHIAIQSLSDERDLLKGYGLNLLFNLVEKNQAFDEATQAAIQNLNSTMDLSLRLLSKLVEKDHAFTEATKAASIGITNQDNDIKEQALRLFKNLVEKDHAFNEAIDAASKSIKNQDQYIQEDAGNLFIALIKHGQGFKEAMNAALVGIIDQNLSTNSIALNLLKTIIIEFPSETKQMIQRFLDIPTIRLSEIMKIELNKLLTE